MYFLQRSARRCLVRNLSRFSGVHVPHRLSIERVIHHVGSHRVVTVRDPGRIFHRSFSPLQHRLRKSGHVSPPPTHPRHHSRTAVPIRAGRAKYLRDIVGAGALWRQHTPKTPGCRNLNRHDLHVVQRGICDGLHTGPARRGVAAGTFNRTRRSCAVAGTRRGRLNRPFAPEKRGRQQNCCQPPFCRHTNTSADLLLDRDSSLVRYAPFEAKVCHTSSRRCIYPCTQGHEPEGSMKLTGLARL